MSKIYLLRDSGEINNGFYAGNRYIDPDEDYFNIHGVYPLASSNNFQGSEDVIVGRVGVC